MEMPLLEKNNDIICGGRREVGNHKWSSLKEAWYLITLPIDEALSELDSNWKWAGLIAEIA